MFRVLFVGSSAHPPLSLIPVYYVERGIIPTMNISYVLWNTTIAETLWAGDKHILGKRGEDLSLSQGIAWHQSMRIAVF